MERVERVSEGGRERWSGGGSQERMLFERAVVTVYLLFRPEHSGPVACSLPGSLLNLLSVVFVVVIVVAV